MTRLFVRFYVGVLAVLFVAWYVHGTVSERYRDADRNRVVEGSYQGAMRLLIEELESVPLSGRDEVLGRLNQRFTLGQRNPVEILKQAELPQAARSRLAQGDDIVFYAPQDSGAFVFAPLSSGEECVRLGPLPGQTPDHIENGLGGGVRLAVAEFAAAPEKGRAAVLRRLTQEFGYPVQVVQLQELPRGPRERIEDGDEIVFFVDENAFIVTPSTVQPQQVVRFGPFPNYEEMDQEAIATTLALVLLPAAVAIALLLRPVAGQLRHVERAAQAISQGDLTARVDEGRVKSATTLAQSFNQMAARTEFLLRTQRELLQAVSHELRTPLSRMRFAIDLIETAKDDAERKERLASLDAATLELDDLVGELLSYVRMETANPVLDRQPIIVREAFQNLIQKHAALHPRVTFAADDGLDNLAIEADPAGFERAIGNLLSNAGRFAEHQVTVHAAQVNGYTTIDVDDDGIGIPESERERVFEPFVRLDNDDNGRGAGLGLALVRRIVTRHGGRVEVLTNPDGGCRIRSTWPTAE